METTRSIAELDKIVQEHATRLLKVDSFISQTQAHMAKQDQQLKVIRSMLDQLMHRNGQFHNSNEKSSQNLDLSNRSYGNLAANSYANQEMDNNSKEKGLFRVAKIETTNQSDLDFEINPSAQEITTKKSDQPKQEIENNQLNKIGKNEVAINQVNKLDVSDSISQHPNNSVFVLDNKKGFGLLHCCTQFIQINCAHKVFDKMPNDEVLKIHEESMIDVKVSSNKEDGVNKSDLEVKQLELVDEMSLPNSLGVQLAGVKKEGGDARLLVENHDTQLIIFIKTSDKEADNSEVREKSYLLKFRIHLWHKWKSKVSVFIQSFLPPLFDEHWAKMSLLSIWIMELKLQKAQRQLQISTEMKIMVGEITEFVFLVQPVKVKIRTEAISRDLDENVLMKSSSAFRVFYYKKGACEFVSAYVFSSGNTHNFTSMIYPLNLSYVGILGCCFITNLHATKLFEVKIVRHIELKIQLLSSVTLVTIVTTIFSWMALPSIFVNLNLGVHEAVSNWQLCLCFVIDWLRIHSVQVPESDGSFLDMLLENIEGSNVIFNVTGGFLAFNGVGIDCIKRGEVKNKESRRATTTVLYVISINTMNKALNWEKAGSIWHRWKSKK